MDEKATLLLFLLIWIVSGVLIETSNGRKIRNDIIDKLEHKNYSKTTKWIMSRSIVALMIFDFISISVAAEPRCRKIDGVVCRRAPRNLSQNE